MGERVKGKVYGKKPRHQDLAEALLRLTVSEDDRSPLREKTCNVSKTSVQPRRSKKSRIGDFESTKEPKCTPNDAIPSEGPAESMAKHRKTPTISTPIHTAEPQHIQDRIGIKARTQASRRPLRRWHPAKKAPPAVKEATADDKYLAPLTQISDVESLVQSFQQWAETMENLLDIVMIGDGSYANVFRLSAKVDPREYSIAKLIPLRPVRGPGARSSELTTIESAASEMRVLAKLSGINGFTEFKGAMLLRGKLPRSFRDACKAFDKRARDKNSTIEVDPKVRRVNFPKQQVWLFAEMADAGKELEQILVEGLGNNHPECGTAPCNALLTARQTRDIFFSAVEALALGEREAQFEHRDLHLSNVCIKRMERTMRDSALGDVNRDFNLIPKVPEFTVTLIDYTLSRANTLEGVIFNPMDDEELFQGEGNLQYDIYRRMKDVMGGKKTPDWSQFNPRTNVLWLYYLLTKLLEHTALPRKPCADQTTKEDQLFHLLEKIADDIDPKTTKGTKSSAEYLLLHIENLDMTE